MQVFCGSSGVFFFQEINPTNRRAQAYMPRIVPTPVHIRALRGPWSLEGKVVRMYEEPDTGVLIALNQDGHRVNPLRVISRGKKLENGESDGGASQH